MTRSDYSYRIEDIQGGREAILIADLNRGRMSVTNNIEEVLQEIKQKEGIRIEEFAIFYRDSEGQWDGWDPINKDFIILNKATSKEAIEVYLGRKKQEEYNKHLKIQELS